MKNIFFLLFSSMMLAQVVYDKSNQDYYINYDTNQINLNYKGTVINGSFEELRASGYKYVVANGGEYHLVMKKSTSNNFYGIDVLKGSYKDVLKGFNKGRKYSKKIEIIYSSLPSVSTKEDFDLITDKQLKKLQLEQEFAKAIKESGYEGIYNIKILKHRNLDYKGLDYFGKIYITDVGITIKTDIPTVDELRGSYNIEMSDEVSKGSFTCEITKGYGDFFSININKESGVGAFTTMRGSSSITTIFTIQ